MVELFFIIILTALISSLCVPLIVLCLARFGYFPPVEFEAFGRTWTFAPNIREVTTHTESFVSLFSFPRVVSASVPPLLIVISQLQFEPSQSAKRDLIEIAIIKTCTTPSCEDLVL